MILEAVANGALHLTAVSLVAPHLTPENVHRLIAAATHKTKRDVEEIVAALRPQPPVAAAIRKLPQPKQSPSDQIAAVVDFELLVGNRQSPARVADSPLKPSDIDRVEVPVRPAPRPAIKPLAPEQYAERWSGTREEDLIREAVATYGDRLWTDDSGLLAPAG